MVVGCIRWLVDLLIERYDFCEKVLYRIAYILEEVILSRGSGAGNYLFFEIFDLIVDFYILVVRGSNRRNEIFIFVGFFDFSVTWSE